ncbi:MAG: hypothetical protein ACLFU9_02370 [Candidatus Bathyarchaeia archaeon]
MKEKKASLQIFKEIERNLGAKNSDVVLEKLVVKISLNDMTTEEKIREASKPLYLKRYE